MMNAAAAQAAPVVTSGIADYEVKKEKMPHEIYNFIIFKCFDACVSNFNNKTLDNQE